MLCGGCGGHGGLFQTGETLGTERSFPRDVGSGVFGSQPGGGRPTFTWDVHAGDCAEEFGGGNLGAVEKCVSVL